MQIAFKILNINFETREIEILLDDQSYIRRYPLNLDKDMLDDYIESLVKGLIFESSQKKSIENKDKRIELKKYELQKNSLLEV
jgi:hypothetical protein